MKMLHTFFIIILFTIRGVFSLSAQTDNSIFLSYGTNHEDRISALGEVDLYTFTGAKDDVIMIRMRDETAVDSYIKLYDPDGELVASSWSDGGLAKIRNYTLEKSGEFTIQAYDRNHNDVGKYGISLHQLNNGSYAVQLPELISIEDSIKQLVGANLYRFKAEKGDILFTQMRAKTVHLECEFFIYNTRGEEIYRAQNKGRLATVGPVEVDEGGAYTIVVTDRGGNDKDLFGLTHMLLNKHELAPPLVCGSNASDQLEKLVHRKAYRLKVSAGQIPLIEARSNNIVLESSMEIYDEKGNQVFKKSSTNKLLSGIIPASNTDKSYLIVMYDRNGNDFGNYGVQVQFLDDSYCPTTIVCGDADQSIKINGLAQSRLFSIEGEAGKPIQVILKETDPLLEPHLRVYDLNGEIIAEKYDGVKADLSDFTFPHNGSFLVVASDRSGNDIGEFYLTSPDVRNTEVVATQCSIVYPGYEPMASTTLRALSAEEGSTYKWSTGETTANISVSPLQDKTYKVTVTSPAGCIQIVETFVEAYNVSCGNGEGQPKVEVCHVKNNGDHQTLCISIEGVEEHLLNGIGHEGCHLGPCGFVSKCEKADSENHQTETVAQRRAVKPLAIFPNPTSGLLNIDLAQFSSESLQMKLFSMDGKLMLDQNVKNNGTMYSLDLIKFTSKNGIYFLSILGEEEIKTKQVILLK